MKLIADLHIHSRYARACSKDLTLPNLAVWAHKKGIHVLGTGDFTHPKWFSEIQTELEESSFPGLYKLRGQQGLKPLFMLSTEVSSIYKQGDKVRRVHNLIFAPHIAAVERLIKRLEDRKVNLKADGRPIMGVTCRDLVVICKDADPAIEIVPAHAWTPHFGVFGSLSGFDNLEEAYGDQSKYIFALETGLSSDPKMNWQVSWLDKYSLISNSDAHSLRKLGREANVFEIDPQELSYLKIISVIQNKKQAEFLSTIEFFPEEGKYRLDGHSEHGYSCLPDKTKRLGGICPECGKKLLRGVLHRVSDLGDREYGFTPENSIPYRSMVPLEEIIAETLDLGVSSKKVTALYEQMVARRPEFEILLDENKKGIAKIATPAIAEGVMRVRKGNVHIDPGYDGVFGSIHLYSAAERGQLNHKTVQPPLFE